MILDKDRMAENHLNLLGIVRQLPGNNVQAQAGALLARDTASPVQAGNFLKDGYRRRRLQRCCRSTIRTNSR